MKRNALLMVVGFGSYVAELGGVLTQLGTEIEHLGLDRLKRHPAEQSNAEVDASLNGTSSAPSLANLLDDREGLSSETILRQQGHG